MKEKKKNRLIVYENGSEVLVCRGAKEKHMLKIWFEEGGRNIDEYNRSKSSFDGVISIESDLRVSPY